MIRSGKPGMSLISLALIGKDASRDSTVGGVSMVLRTKLPGVLISIGVIDGRRRNYDRRRFDGLKSKVLSEYRQNYR